MNHLERINIETDVFISANFPDDIGLHCTIAALYILSLDYFL